MNKLWQVAREEVVFHLRQASFYLSLGLMLVTFMAAGLLPRLREATAQSPLNEVKTILNVEENFSRATGYVDQAGVIGTVPAGQAPYLEAFASEREAAAALAEGAIESYYVIEADYLARGVVREVSGSPEAFAESDAAFQGVLRANVLEAMADPAVAARLVDPMVLVRRGPAPARFAFLPGDLPLERLGTALLVAGLFAYLINAGSVLTLRALQREVQWRVLETMVTSVRPWQLLGGKLLGLNLLVGMEATLTLGAGFLVYGRTAGSGLAALPLAVVLASLPYMFLGYLAVSGAMVAVAALWPMLSESMHLQGLLRLLVLSPLMGGLLILPDAEGPLAVALTVNPISSPLLMPFRLLLVPVPLWQLVLGLFLLLLWAAGLFWLSTRLFRANSLLTGQGVSLGRLWRVVWR